MNSHTNLHPLIWPIKPIKISHACEAYITLTYRPHQMSGADQANLVRCLVTALQTVGIVILNKEIHRKGRFKRLVKSISLYSLISQREKIAMYLLRCRSYIPIGHERQSFVKFVLSKYLVSDVPVNFISRMTELNNFQSAHQGPSTRKWKLQTSQP
jgi:hypothetical protein